MGQILTYALVTSNKGPCTILTPVQFPARKAEWSTHRNFTLVPLFSWPHQATGLVQLDTAARLHFFQINCRINTGPMQRPHENCMGPAQDSSECSIPYELRTGPIQDNQNLQMWHFWYEYLGSNAQCIICLPYRVWMIFVVHDIIIIKSKTFKHKRPDMLRCNFNSRTRNGAFGAHNWNTPKSTLNEHLQLDESTARWQLKWPLSLSGRSIHLTLVTKWSWSWSWMTYCHPLCAMSISPPILRYSCFKIWPWKSMVKVMCVVKGQGHVWPWKFKCQGYGQGQSHWSHLRPGIQSICLLFVSGQSDHFWLRYSKFYIWPWKFKVKVMAKVKTYGPIWALKFNRYVCISFHGNRTIFGWDI